MSRPLQKCINQLIIIWVVQVEQTPLPLLFMRTVIQAVGTFPTLVLSKSLILSCKAL
jgi:hypothetical protein